MMPTAATTTAPQPMNRKARRDAAKGRGQLSARKKPKLGGLYLLDWARPFEGSDTLDLKIKVRDCLQTLKDGTSEAHHFDYVAMAFNVAMVRAESIDPSLVTTVQRGMDAMVRMRERAQRGLNLRFDSPGLRDTPPAIDVYEAILDASSPLQMALASKEAYKRITNGDVLRIITS